ncbi:MAG: hypothetical protein KDB27_32275 [Planctomycetales bacterium]|nr:hypothetical protein [Planctomycetales bacterium]
MITSILIALCVFSISSSTEAQVQKIEFSQHAPPGKQIIVGGNLQPNPLAAEGSRTRPGPDGPIVELPLDPTTKKICLETNSTGPVCSSADGIARPGDSNLDGFFDTDDLTLAMVSGEFEDLIPSNSSWNDGDWNLDGEFDTTDIRIAFEANRYVSSRPAVTTSPVPEPAFNVLWLIGGLPFLLRRRR